MSKTIDALTKARDNAVEQLYQTSTQLRGTERQLSGWRVDAYNAEGKLADLRNAAQSLFDALDYVLGPEWRSDTLVNGEQSDEVNEAWCRLAKELGRDKE